MVDQTWLVWYACVATATCTAKFGQTPNSGHCDRPSIAKIRTAVSAAQYPDPPFQL